MTTWPTKTSPMAGAGEKHNQYYLDWLAKQAEGPARQKKYKDDFANLQLELANNPEVSAALLRKYAREESIEIETVYSMMRELGYAPDDNDKKFIKARSARELNELPPSIIDSPASPSPIFIHTDKVPRPQRGRAPNSDGQYDDPTRNH